VPGAIAGASLHFAQVGRIGGAVASHKKVTSCDGAAFERGNIAHRRTSSLDEWGFHAHV
jgi:hypothetical protein